MTAPTISVVIPTLNSSSFLEKCLFSISKQKYPKQKLEIIVSDGGSTDDTLKVAKKYNAKIVYNKLKTAESGKAAAVKVAKGDLIALIDSDNILPNAHWFLDMVKPFEDKEIILAEPIKYTHRKSDPLLTRYFALLGMNDPICLFIGNYDRYSFVTKRWTDLNFPNEKKDGYIKITLNSEPIPTIGANGTLIRSEHLKKMVEKSSYLFDVDILLKIIRVKGATNIAKVDTSIVHTFVENNVTKFFSKQLRRINDMSFHKSKKNRDLNWEKEFFWRIVKFIFSCFLVFPIVYQTVVGYKNKPDIAWLFHPLACYSTLFIYLYGWVRGKISPSESNRLNWKQ